MDLIITSGGLGPTADDMTVEVVAGFCGRELVLDEVLEKKIAEILRSMMRRFPDRDFDAVLAANRKQAMVPAGAQVIDPVGTAPGVIVPGTPTVLVLPGPPRELQPMWHTATGLPAVQQAIAGRTVYRQDIVRMFGLPESGLAETLRQAQRSIDGFDRLEITTCLRRGELEIVTRYEPTDAETYARLVDTLREQHPREVFSTDGSYIDDQVAHLLAGRRIATAESCTAGMIAARLTDRAGSSAYVMGGAVVYSNEAKSEVLGVDPALIAEHGAVSEPVAEAMAAGALRRFDADTAIAITGIAGPDGGTPDKPVGTVCFTVASSRRAAIDTDHAAAGQPGRHPGPLDDGRYAPAATGVGRVARSVPFVVVPHRHHGAQDLLGPAETGEMALARDDVQRGVGERGHHVLAMRERNDVVAVAVPPVHRDLDLVEPEPPRPGEHHDVGERRGQLFAAAVEQVVEEHRLELGAAQQPAVTFRRDRGVHLERGGGDGSDQLDQGGGGEPHRQPCHLEDRARPDCPASSRHR